MSAIPFKLDGEAREFVEKGSGMGLFVAHGALVREMPMEDGTTRAAGLLALRFVDASPPFAEWVLLPVDLETGKPAPEGVDNAALSTLFERRIRDALI